MPATPSHYEILKRSNSPTRLAMVVALLALLVATTLMLTERGDPDRELPRGILPGNPQRGSELFYERGCAECHGVAAGGGDLEPGVSPLRGAPSDLSEVAGAMWNHAPEMWAELETLDASASAITPREFVDVMAFLFTAGYMEEEGDPVRGEAVLAAKGCLDCHTIGKAESKLGPDLADWPSSTSSLVWAQLMWRHVPGMQKMIREKGLTWPQISTSETLDLLAFLRSIGEDSRSPTPRVGDPWVGRYLFRKHCQHCHRAEVRGGDIGPDLSAPSAPRTLLGLTTSLWNHVPAMNERIKEMEVEQPSFSEQEMADLITYVFAIRYVVPPGNAAVGASVYSRSCSLCHGKAGEGDTGPDLRSLGARSGPAFMAATLWNHGPGMYEEMTQRGLEWPLLEKDETADLIEYLRGLGPGGVAEESRSRDVTR